MLKAFNSFGMAAMQKASILICAREHNGWHNDIEWAEYRWRNWFDGRCGAPATLSSATCRLCKPFCGHSFFPLPSFGISLGLCVAGIRLAYSLIWMGHRFIWMIKAFNVCLMIPNMNARTNTVQSPYDLAGDEQTTRHVPTLAIYIGCCPCINCLSVQLLAV